MRVIIDASLLTLYPPLSSLFHGATEMLLKRLARLLATRHDVHVLSVEQEEQIYEGATWWPQERGPRVGDLLISFPNVANRGHFKVDRHIVFQVSPHVELAPGWEKAHFVAISQTQSKLTKQESPQIAEERLHVIRPGVDIKPNAPREIPNRLIYCSSPDRGLIHLCNIWSRLKQEIPDITIRVTYRTDAWINQHRWDHNAWAAQALALERWFTDPSVLPGISDSVYNEQQLAQLHAMPMDPANLGDGAHMLAGMECAAAHCALLYSNCEGLPEIFEKAADFLALPVDEDTWIEQIVNILSDKERLQEMQERAYHWALTQPWNIWEEQWVQLIEGTWPKQDNTNSAMAAVSAAAP